MSLTLQVRTQKDWRQKFTKSKNLLYLLPFLVLCGRNLLPAWHPSLQVRTSLLHHVMDSRRKRIILCLCHVVLLFMFVPKTHIVCLLSKSTIWAPKEWYLMKNISEAGSKLFTYFSPSSLHSGFLSLFLGFSWPFVQRFLEEINYFSGILNILASLENK